MPILTKTFTIACAATTCLLMSRTVSVGQLFLYYPLVFNRRRLELWRLIANFFVFDTKLSLSWLLSMNLFIQHSGYLERTRFRGDTKAYAFVWIIIMASLLALNALLFYLGLPFSWLCSNFMGPSLSFVFEYLWARQNPNARVLLFGFIVVRAAYLPIVLVGLSMLIGGNYILGLIVAHVYVYFTDVLPELFADEKIPPVEPNNSSAAQPGAVDEAVNDEQDENQHPHHD